MDFCQFRSHAEYNCSGCLNFVVQYGFTVSKLAQIIVATECHNTYAHLQDSRKSRQRRVYISNTIIIPTPTRLDGQVASVGDYKHQCHYIPTPTRLVNKLTVWDYNYYMQHPHLQDSIRCGTPMPLHIHLNKQVTSVGDVLCNTNATTYPHLQDSINKSPVWGTINTNVTTPHLQDSIKVWGTINT